MKHKGGAFLSGLFGKKNNVSDLYSMDSYSNIAGFNSHASTATTSVLSKYMFYILIAVIAVLVLLILVHFTITPIFRFQPGDNGIIGVPGSDDSNAYWDTAASAAQPIHDPFPSKSSEWSMGLSIIIDDPTRNTGAPRILFQRGGELVENYVYDASHTILHMFQSHKLPNLVIYMDQLNNDIYVSTVSRSQSGQNSLETVVVPNFPVRTPVRLGVGVYSRFMEVYVSGKLYKSHTYKHNSIQQNVGDIYPPTTAIASNVARVRFLKLWQRTLTAAEYRRDGAPGTIESKDIPDTCVA